MYVLISAKIRTSCGSPAYASHNELQGYRAQIDRKLYKKAMQHTLSNYPNLEIRSASVKDVVLSDAGQGDAAQRVIGLRVGTGLSLQPSLACALIC